MVEQNIDSCQFLTGLWTTTCLQERVLLSPDGNAPSYHQFTVAAPGGVPGVLAPLDQAPRTTKIDLYIVQVQMVAHLQFH